ncbi:MAG: hypothetical protein M1818_003603 [Claussenomyces sp. TS43310]|nr:MAG: hypothetical protein M1818_003603 [Claussenomyces sp. TS43310]
MADSKSPLANGGELDWASDDKNPYNWSMRKRVYHAVLPALFGLVVTFASSIYTSAVPQVMEVFDVSNTAALLPFSLFLLGLAFGPILAAPLSERFGRTATYMISLPIFALFTLGAGWAQTFGALVACRLFAGIFASPPLVVGAGTNADLWQPESRAVMTTLFALCPYLGPALGPLIGGFAVANKGWRWTEWIILFFAVVVYVLALGMKETYKKTILQRHAQKLGIATPPGPSGLVALKFVFYVTFFRPLHMLYTEPIVIAWSLYIGFSFAVLYSFFAAFPYVYRTVYGFDIQQIGLTFVSIAIGSILGALTVILVDRLLYQKRHMIRKSQGAAGAVPPEYRLYAAMVGSFGLPVGLFWYAWTARQDIHWISSLIAAVFIAWGNLCIFMSGLLYLLDVYEALMGASAVAATSLFRYVLAAVFPLFINQMYTRLGVGWATSVFAFISVAMMPIPWVLFKWGPALRASSKCATSKA